MSLLKIVCLKETRNSFKKWPLNLDGFQTKPLWKLEILQKLLFLNLINLLHLIDNYTQLLFPLTVPFHIFMSQTLTDNFSGLHKNMNCAFPLK